MSYGHLKGLQANPYQFNYKKIIKWNKQNNTKGLKT